MAELKRDPENGMLVGPDNCHYPNEHQVYHYAYLGLCGCGAPEEAYNFCRDILVLCDRRAHLDGRGDWIDAESATAALIATMPDVAAHVLLHLFTHLELLEHGGSVGGSWLTPTGQEIVDLRSVTQEDMDAEWPPLDKTV